MACGLFIINRQGVTPMNSYGDTGAFTVTKAIKVSQLTIGFNFFWIGHGDLFQDTLIQGLF